MQVLHTYIINHRDYGWVTIYCTVGDQYYMGSLNGIKPISIGEAINYITQ